MRRFEPGAKVRPLSNFSLVLLDGAPDGTEVGSLGLKVVGRLSEVGTVKDVRNVPYNFNEWESGRERRLGTVVHQFCLVQADPPRTDLGWADAMNMVPVDAQAVLAKVVDIWECVSHYLTIEEARAEVARRSESHEACVVPEDSYQRELVELNTKPRPSPRR